MNFLLSHLKRKKILNSFRSCAAMSIILMIACSCSWSVAYSQSYYYFVTDINVPKGPAHIYKTFLSLQPDGRTTARIQYNSGPSNKLYLYELNLADSSIEANKASRYLIPTDEGRPLLDADPAGFVLPRFIFKKQHDSTGYYYEPAGTESKDATGKWVTAETSVSQQKTDKDLRSDEPFVSSFYFESDVFYQYIFEQKTRATPVIRPERMFLLVVANTNDATVGKSAQTDLGKVSHLFTTLASDLGIVKISPVLISGNGYSKQAVENALSTIEKQRPSSTDIIVFYFSGHGFRLQADKSLYPRMSFRTAGNKANNEVGENMPLEDVYNRMKALNPRVCMILGDCCNADIYANPIFGDDMITPKGGGYLGNFNIANGKKLFLPPAPVSIIIGSVSKNHFSVGHPDIGGYYTHFFTAELEKNLWGYYSNSVKLFGGQGNASWLRMALAARKNTYWKSKAKQCGDTPNDRCIQEAEIIVNPAQ